MKRFILLCGLMSLDIMPTAVIKTYQDLQEFVMPIPCDSRRLGAVVFQSSTKPSLFKRQKAVVKKIDSLMPFVQVAIADTSCPALQEAATQMGIESYPALVLFKEGSPISITNRNRMPITYGLGLLSNQSNCAPDLISDIELKKFILNNFCNDIKDVEMERTEHAARASLLAEKRPGIYSTGGAWPDWIAAFNPWPLYWG